MPSEIMSDGSTNGQEIKLPGDQGQQMPGLAEIIARIKAKHAAQQQQQQQAQQAGNPGAMPMDSQGGPQTVAIRGERPIQAQPVSGGPQAGPPMMGQRVGVTMGEPTRQITLDPMRVQVPAGQSQAQQGQPMQLPPMRVQVPGGQQQPVNPQASMDPRAARLRALMGQGMSFAQAMRAIQQG